MCEHQMFTLFMSCVCSENCAKCFRNLGAWSAQFRNEIWGGSLRNSGTGQLAGRVCVGLARSMHARSVMCGQEQPVDQSTPHPSEFYHPLAAT